MDREALVEMDGTALVGFVAAKHAAVVAEQSDLISAIGVMDARELWRADGATSMAAWLMGALKVDYRSACEWVRMATALQELPALSSVFAEGTTSFESVAAATKLAEGAQDQSLAEWAATDARVAKLAEEASPGDLKDELARVAAAGEVKRASLRYWQAPDGYFHFRGWLAPEDGAAFATAIERAEIKEDQPNPETGTYDPPDERAGNALLRVASSALTRDKDRARATVVVHVPLHALITGEGEAELAATGGYVSAEVARRLACDGRIEHVFENAHGAVGIGRMTRYPDEKMERYIRGRDRTCRFPGCRRRRHLEMHHIVFWTNMGPTFTTNMACLCLPHHKLVHDGGWSITGNPEPGPGPMSTLQFLRPDGSVFEPAQDLMAAVRAWARAKDGAGGSPPNGGAPGGSPPDGSPPNGRGDPEAWIAPTLGGE